MGLLTMVIGVVASLAQRSPNSLNETMSITFNMLVFCCVWFSFLPIDLSNMGNFIAAAESISVIVSGAGLLVCIFLPKYYIILWKPELNKREHFREI